MEERTTDSRYAVDPVEEGGNRLSEKRCTTSLQPSPHFMAERDLRGGTKNSCIAVATPVLERSAVFKSTKRWNNFPPPRHTGEGRGEGGPPIQNVFYAAA